jgi:hypothetical protein
MALLLARFHLAFWLSKLMESSLQGWSNGYQALYRLSGKPQAESLLPFQPPVTLR